MMDDREKFYITTTLPYVNSKPHMGHAQEFTYADILARYQKMLGKDVVFNTGTDEHGQKIYEKAKEEGRDPQAYADEYAEKFKIILKPGTGLNVSYTDFIRTTDPHHIAAAQEFWKRCDAAGDIYRKLYKIKYCVGCELEKTESELDGQGRCLLHPNLEIQIIEEENYFFRWSKYQEPLLKFYRDNGDFVVPDFRFNEIIKFVEGGLQDFSISRLKDKMPWGIPVPDDDTQVMYVWFDALINYVSTLGWPDNQEKFAAFWGEHGARRAVQIAGKDNLRQQAAMWQAMLMSAGLPNSGQIIIHGFITSGGQKMSKSLGNVIDPLEVIQKYGTDALRYWLAREASTFEDADFTWERFKECYNANLANGLGNLVSRVLKMAITNGVELSTGDMTIELENGPFNYRGHLDRCDIQKAADVIWEKIQELDKFIQQTEPFKTVKTDAEKAKKDIHYLLQNLWLIAEWLKPFLPETADKIISVLQDLKLENIPRLFPRIE